MTLPADELLAYNPTVAARRLGVSKGTLYAMLRAGTIGHVKQGSRTLVPDFELVRYLRENLSTAFGDDV